MLWWWLYLYTSNKENALMHLECVICHILKAFHLLWKYGFRKRKRMKAGTNNPSGDAAMKTESIHTWLMENTWISHGSFHPTHSFFYSQNPEICFEYAYKHASFINPFLKVHVKTHAHLGAAKLHSPEIKGKSKPNDQAHHQLHALSLTRHSVGMSHWPCAGERRVCLAWAGLCLSSSTQVQWGVLVCAVIVLL